MASVQLTNRLTATDNNLFTPNQNDAAGATTPFKDYILEVQLVNQPISINLFKDLSASYDPYVEVFQIPKGSKGANLDQTGTFVARNDDEIPTVILNSKIPSPSTDYFNGASDPLTSVPGVDYLLRVTSFSALTSTPQPFTLQVSTPNGNVALKDPVTGGTLDAAGNIIRGLPGDPLTGDLPVRRFFDKQAGSHFYTTDPSEKADRLNNPARYQSEGDDFIAPANGNAKVQRFFNTASGTYFYTNKPTDIQFIRDNLPQFRAEGEVFNSYNTAVSGAIPVYRFTNLSRERENSQNITHFFTSSQADRRDVQMRSDFRDEGVAFYALPPA
ncbi:hypothetical protein QUA35_13605 [Microcoleus sp. N9_B2]|uniref:hypothetical protein n=1 Tax=unclassified Microcoleus TaxID=2642155 RepID=UPI002FCFB9DF